MTRRFIPPESGAHVHLCLIREHQCRHQCLRSRRRFTSEPEITGLDAQRFAHGKERIEGEFLRHHADDAARGAGNGAARRARAPWRVLGWRASGRNDIDKGGFTGAVGTEQPEELAAINGEIDALQGVNVGINACAARNRDCRTSTRLS